MEYDKCVLELDPEPLPPLELDPEPLLLPLPLPDPDPEPDDELPDPEPLLPPSVVATEDPLPFPAGVLLPSPFPLLLLADILDKSENIGLSLFVIPYAATAAAIHNTTIIEIIIFALSNFFPPLNIYYV